MIHRRGFTLVEILLAVSLLGVFTLLASRLLGANMRITQGTLTADSNTARFDRAIRMLRTDVAASDSIESSAPGVVRIRNSANQTVEWKTAGNSVSRSIGTETREWEVGQPLHLKLDGAVVLLSVSPADEIAMASFPKGAPR